jgi:hypothetical protein
LTVWIVPDIVMVEVPCVKIDVAPEVFHEPETVHDPEVREMVAAVPSVIVTLVKVTVEVLALKVPEDDMTRLAPPERVSPLVVRDSPDPVMLNVFDTSMAVLIVIVPAIVRL